MEPLHAPKRVGQEREKVDRSGLIWILVIALGVVAAIAYDHLGPPAQDAALQGGSAEAGVAGTSPAGGTGTALFGERKPVQEAPLQTAPALPKESYGAPVTYVTDSEACRKLRAQTDRIRADIRKASSAAQKKELDLDLRSVRLRGAELGCWSGGAE